MSVQPGAGIRNQGRFATLNLEYPMSLGTFTSYVDAQQAVDTLSDSGFPVENCLIVGTHLRQLERVTGRLTWSKVLLGGALTGVWMGLFVGLIFAMFDPGNSGVMLVVSTMFFGAVFGIVWASVGYAMTGGRRDFTSVSQIVPSLFELLCEHKVAAQARELLVSKGIHTGPATVPGAPAGAPAGAAATAGAPMSGAPMTGAPTGAPGEATTASTPGAQGSAAEQPRYGQNPPA